MKNKAGVDNGPYVESFTAKKPVGIDELLGHALGSVRLSYDDFCRLTPDEFTVVCKSYNERMEAEAHGDWERMRLLASIVISPHVKGRITPEKLLPFPWEKEKQTQQRVPVSKEEAKSRFERLVSGK